MIEYIALTIKKLEELSVREDLQIEVESCIEELKREVVAQEEWHKFLQF